MKEFLIGIWNCITHPYILSSLLFTLVIYILDDVRIRGDKDD